MAFNGTPTQVWDRNTPNDGILINNEVLRQYANDNDLDARALPGYDDAGTPTNFDILLWNIAAGQYKRTDINAIDLFSRKDFLRQSILNPSGRINQRAKASPNLVDDTYFNDHWTLLKENASVTDGIVEYSPSDDAIKVQINEPTLTTRFGLIHFIENSVAAQYAGQKASLSFQVRSNNSNIANIRAAVLSWDSVADVLTSDVVDVWGAAPTLVTNWTFENTAINQSVTTGFTTITIPDIDIDTANTTNLALFIWVPDLVNNTNLFIKDVQLNLGVEALTFGARHPLIEQLFALRFYQTTYREGVEAGTATLEGGLIFNTVDGTVGNVAVQSRDFTLPMRITPVIRTFGLGGTQNTVSNERTTATANEKSVNNGLVTGQGTEKGFLSDFDISPAAPVGSAGTRAFHYDADAAL